jgi:hypothetical protein
MEVGPSSRRRKRETMQGLFRAACYVIDDNSDAAETLAELLQSFGHRVRIARTGPETIEAVAALRSPGGRASGYRYARYGRL